MSYHDTKDESRKNPYIVVCWNYFRHVHSYLYSFENQINTVFDILLPCIHTQVHSNIKFVILAMHYSSALTSIAKNERQWEKKKVSCGITKFAVLSSLLNIWGLIRRYYSLSTSCKVNLIHISTITGVWEWLCT